MKKNKWIKIMAFLALFWVIIWIAWTSLLIIFGNNKTESDTQVELTPEKLKQLQKMIGSWNTLNEWSWELIWTWKLNK